MLNKKLSLFMLPLIAIFSLQANDPFGDDMFKEMMKMQKEMDTIFDQMHKKMQESTTKLVRPMATSSRPNQQSFIDKGNSYEYITTIPENKENKIDIKVKDSVLAIRAKIIENKENKTTNSFRSSSSIKMYQQSIPLPKDADEVSLNAGYSNGRLVLTLQKNASTSRTIPLNAHKEIVKENNTSSENNISKENNISNKMSINTDLPSLG